MGVGLFEEALELISEYKDVVFLINFVDGRQFRRAVKSMTAGNCLRIPYEPDPFVLPKDKNSREFSGSWPIFVSTKE